MCSTCGCGNESTIAITKHGDKPIHFHTHDGMKWHAHHTHQHGHENGHEHEHHHHSSGSTLLTLEQDILSNNKLAAERNRGYLEALSVCALNLVSSPGSGKTTLLEKTLESPSGSLDFAVIEGDQQTSNDADRIAKFNTPVVQVNTGKAWHLDAEMISQALRILKPGQGSILFIENVGNLVCPAMFDLGESHRVVIISVTEGTDKAVKYPDMFHTSDLCIINKTDLLPYVDFDIAKAREYALRVNHNLEFIELSATRGDGMDQWYDWLKNKIPVTS